MNQRSLKDWKEAGYEIGPDGKSFVKRASPAVAAKTEVAPRAAIRLPDPDRDEPNQTERRFRSYYERLWKPSIMLYEPFTLRLPSGTRWTMDWFMEWPDGIRLHVEVKGAHIHNSRSVHAFKEAAAAFKFERWKFLFAQWKGGQWLLSGYQRP